MLRVCGPGVSTTFWGKAIHPSRWTAQIVLDRFLEKKGNRTQSCVGKEGGMNLGEGMNIAKAHFMKYSENYEKQTSKKK